MKQATSKNSKAVPDVFESRAGGVKFEGTSYVLQNGVLFDSLSKARIPMGTCHARTDGVRYTVGDRGFSAAGQYLGQLDLRHGLALINKPKTVPKSNSKKPVSTGKPDPGKPTTLDPNADLIVDPVVDPVVDFNDEEDVSDPSSESGIPDGDPLED
jgi:hypothetical protein